MALYRKPGLHSGLQFSKNNRVVALQRLVEQPPQQLLIRVAITPPYPTTVEFFEVIKAMAGSKIMLVCLLAFGAFAIASAAGGGRKLRQDMMEGDMIESPLLPPVVENVIEDVLMEGGGRKLKQDMLVPVIEDVVEDVLEGGGRKLRQALEGGMMEGDVIESPLLPPAVESVIEDELMEGGGRKLRQDMMNEPMLAPIVENVIEDVLEGGGRKLKQEAVPVLIPAVVIVPPETELLP